MPPKVNEFFAAGRELYLKEMDKVISRVAEIVAKDLTAAKNRIAAGKTEIATYVKGLPRDLQKVGAQASKEIGDQFQQLESDVDAKQNALVNSLASKYVEARKGLDDRIEALQAENKGLIDKAIGAIKAVINTIRQLAAMLRDIFVKAAGVVGQIIKSPSRFLGNMVGAVKGGIQRFATNILKHLREGLMGWLFGSLAQGGIELPESFDPKGIVKLLASIFGLSWANIRARLVNAIGERAVGIIVKSNEIFSPLSKEGLAGVWHLIVKEVGDVKDMIVEKAKSFVVTEIIMAGIEWLISLLNPVSAFIKACKLIYQIVMFFVENASRIARFVDTILDSVGDIARGAVGGVAEKIESALAQMVPILIGFLARVLNISGIGKRIREIVQALQKPVNKALDGIIATGLKLAGPAIRGAKGIATKVKAKVEQGKAYVKGKVEAGKEWAKGRIDAVTGRRPGPAGVAPPERATEATSLPFTIGGNTHTAVVDRTGAVTLRSSPIPIDGRDGIIAEVEKATKTNKAFKGVQDRLRERIEAVRAAATALEAAPASGKSAALRALTDAVVKLLSTHGTKKEKQKGAEPSEVPVQIPGTEDTSISASHYDLRIAAKGLTFTGTSIGRSGEFEPKWVDLPGTSVVDEKGKPVLDEEGRPLVNKEGRPRVEPLPIEEYQVGMNVSFVTLRATDEGAVVPGSDTEEMARLGEKNRATRDKKIEKAMKVAAGGTQPGMKVRVEPVKPAAPNHWRGHDAELKLIEEINFRLRPHLKLPKNDYAPSDVRSHGVTGTVWLHSDFVICASCDAAIRGFRRMFPNVHVEVTSSGLLTPAGEKTARRRWN